MNFPLPEKTRTSSGDDRRVGFEIEFAGIDPDQCIRLLHDLLGGQLVDESTFAKKLETREYGTFVVEMDAAFLTEGRYKDYLDAVGIRQEDIRDKDREALEKLLQDVAATVVPCEVVMPPIAMNKLAIADEIVALLRKEKARGTGSSLLYAFGLHINVELAADEPSAMLDIMRAFALLFDWICAASEVDFSRRLTPYIKRYPDAYLKVILASDYQPNLETLINDYLEHIPSRNHALDMLPAFAHFAEKQVLARADEPDLIKPRPAFHYRLANCSIDDPAWFIADEWQYWLAIEKLAADSRRLAELSQAWLEQAATSLPFSNKKWIETVKTCID